MADQRPGWDGLLAPGERILWQGRPDARIAWGDLLRPETAMGAFFTLFSTFWIIGAAGASAKSDDLMGRIFPLFGTIFLAVGLWMLGGRLLGDALMRSRTHYTLTDQAAYIATNLGRRKLDRYPLSPMTQLALDDGDPGTVWFAEETVRNSEGGTSRRRFGFRRIVDARGVFGLLRDAQRAAEPTPSMSAFSRP